MPIVGNPVAQRISLLSLLPAALLLACGSGEDGAAGVDGSPVAASESEPASESDSAEADAPVSSPELQRERRGTPAGPCGLDTGFDGDDHCILPPLPEEGIHLHAGPADYDDPDALEPYLLGPGGEDVRCYRTRPSDDGFYYFRQQNRMRPGSHHLIIRLVDGDGLEEGPAPCTSPFGGGESLGGVPGSQTSIRDIPEQDEMAPENAGVGRRLPEGAMAEFELHYVNTTEEPMLREAWVNLYYKDDVTDPLRGISLIGGLAMNIPPGAREILNQSCEVSNEGRVFELFGHFHANTERFSAWLHREDERTLVYESYNWAEPATLVYDTVTENPEPDPERLIDGGISGLLTLQPGDRIEWECEVNNTQDIPLRFANEAYTAEMCILFGALLSESGGLRCMIP